MNKKEIIYINFKLTPCLSCHHSGLVLSMLRNEKKITFTSTSTELDDVVQHPFLFYARIVIMITEEKCCSISRAKKKKKNKFRDLKETLKVFCCLSL
jgi:hypothetical protein